MENLGMRNVLLWAVLAGILIFVNLLIFSKEQILENGDTLLLQLAPRDPRSLLQGDYMILRYTLAAKIGAGLNDSSSIDGKAVVQLDAHGVARFVRLHDPSQPLNADQRLLAFRARGGRIRLASDAYFFQEGREKHYRNARYGELRVAADGNAVLVGLRDGDGRVLGGDEQR
ncbi:MAG: hypothetical protein N838_29505 [Thiohalocapsa sp. PB-PSB1]|nr:MAG: hypothetical protein N838_29505 [Thiohalocapsa sp. PB-PSB1]